ncbi:dipeptide/oligopeptide/nickel ABC transporter permease/ATP-binding protein [Arthrobacter sp. ISL-30]|uniref:dipeptide/oligopeptide/nickel ABC transporter permease/ATP-binding protein n=1 Tax=Arthrobacter sp. ISL-30 TaxID=2819109 RepID=UPI001BE73C25|nr:dipeptide/oligopeptide/nickel ABC transporter permease/ATP-binding protein [Arthrobacter sp. ISL-30]MBT2513623.1 dipeptide/oligopeptide/nickel ABC transporter permease/ATP-binding protein [Arthrobacter sp. ISL-30]
MTNLAHSTDPQIVTAPQETAKVSLFRRILRNPMALGSLTFLAVAVFCAAFAQFLAPHDPNTSVISNVLSPAGGENPLGTDGAGRDVLSRLLYGAQFSLAGALVALATALVIGVTGGLLAGYFGKWIDTGWTWVISLLMALPNIIVLLAARAVVGPSLWAAMLIFGIMLSPAFFRLVYASVSAVRNELYVDAARVSGLSDSRIIARHVLTVVRAPIVIQSAIVGGIALAVQSGLEFLGLGDIKVPTWGAMLSDGFTNLYTAPTLILWPALAIGLTLIALTLLANSLRDELERSTGPRKQNRRKPTKPQPEAAAEDIVRHDEREPEGEIVLDVSHLSVGYPTPDGGIKRVVNDVSLTVRRGEVHGLVGESGSGKTQTAWSILRLLPEGGKIVGGSIHFQGKDLATLSEQEMEKLRGRKIAYIPQEPMSNLDPAFTIGSQLVEPMRICLKISAREARERALALLARVGIPNPERTFAAYPHEVSGGMAQRVLIAGAISCNPDLLIADEPTTALDVTVQAEVLDLLRDLQSEFQMAVILVTHNFGVVADLCDRVSVMRLGRIVETGPTRSIFADPRHPYTQELLGAILSEAEPRGPLVTAGAPGQPVSTRSASNQKGAVQ